MKCRVCRGPAVIDVRRQNANYCSEHFLRMCRDQVAKTIDEFSMIEHGQRVLVAVSGGKDSLACWDILRHLGYDADGFVIGLGIGEYSDESSSHARAFADERGLKLLSCDLREEYGFDVPTAASATRRVPCSACGLSKRHLFDKAALDNGYDVVATGHNLDDEAAVLFGNVLRWQTDYLGRQLPVLPERHGFPRKVKPLVRLSERDMAAYCLLTGIDYIVEECPMAAGNKHLGYKDVLNQLEVQSPGSKLDFYFGYLRRASPRFVPDAEAEQEGLGPCERCGAPTVDRLCAVLQAGRADRRRGAGAAPDTLMAEAFGVGDKVLLVDNKDRRYLITLTEGGEFHSHTGVISHGDIAGTPEGTTFRSSRGSRFVAFRPRLSDFVLKMPRGAQVIYPKDLGPLLLLADIHPGVRVLESGVGSGALSMAMVRAGADVVGYELREEFAARAIENVRGFLGDDAAERYRVDLRNCYDGIDESEVDRVVLDLPEPWQVVKHAERALGPGGLFVAYTPTIVQAVQLRETLESSRFALAETLEVLHRSWHIEGQSVRPDHRMVAHTGFLTAARLLADQS